MGCLKLLWLLHAAVLPFSVGQPTVSSTVFVAGYSQSISENGDAGQLAPSSAPYFISKLNFDSIPDMVVVGAADWLYILNQNLTVAAQFNFPPNASSAACSVAIGYNTDYVCRNHLRVFPSSPTDPTKLMVCGSEAIGTPSCRAVNISNMLNFTSVAAANGMVSIRPDFYGSGIAYNVNNQRGINFFAVSTLTLDASNTGLFFLTFSYTNPTDPNTLSTVLQLRTNSIANFRTPVFVDTYVANYAPRTALLPGVQDTISPDEHKYFYVFVKDVDSTNKPISQVVRVCQNDPGNSPDNAPLTLVKARINCNSAASSTNYSSISGVAFNQMGRYYQNGDWALFMYGIFTTSIGGVPVSAVCVYPANNSVDDVTGRFGRNGGVFDIFRTLLVNPNTGIQTTSGYVECTPNGNMARPDYTYTDTVLPITQIGSEPLAVINGVTISKIVVDKTCVFTNNITSHICVIQDVLFLGTAVGTVLKVTMGYNGSSVVPIISEEIKLDDTSSVRQMEIQQQGGVKYLYVNTDTSIYRLPVQRCNRFTTCSACVASRDPYCVWNTSCVVSPIVPTNYNGSVNIPSNLYQNMPTNYNGSVNISSNLYQNMPINYNGSVNIPSNLYQNIHTGVVDCSGAATPLPTTPLVTSSAATVGTTPPTTTTTTPPTTTTTTANTETNTFQGAVAAKSILSNTPSIGIVGGLGGLCVFLILVVLVLLCCLVCRRRRLPNPSDPTSSQSDVIENRTAGLMSLDRKQLVLHVDRDSVYFRSTSIQSETDEGQCQVKASSAGVHVASTIQEKEEEAPDTSLTAI